MASQTALDKGQKNRRLDSCLQDIYSQITEGHIPLPLCPPLTDHRLCEQKLNYFIHEALESGHIERLLMHSVKRNKGIHKLVQTFHTRGISVTTLLPCQSSTLEEQTGI